MLALHLKGFVLAVLCGAAAGLAGDLADGSVQVLWIVIAVVAVLLVTIGVGFIRRIATTYTITDQRLTIDYGLLKRDVHETRLERVQNVNLAQSLFERMLHVGTVDFDTAGGAEFDFAFRGIGNPREIVRTVDRALHQLQRGAPADAPAALDP
jgi:uncharacterized membrane protein YdbT with pleckstrin-like domain